MADVTVPDEIILPIAKFDDKTQQELHRALTEYSNAITQSFSSIEDLDDTKVKASSSDATAGFLDAKVDDTTIEVSSNLLAIKALGVDTAQLAALSVTTAKIAALAVTTAKIAALAVTSAELATNSVTTAKITDSNVTKAKIENVENLKVLGNTSGSATAPQEVDILDEDTMSSDSATAIATQQSIKAFVETEVAAITGPALGTWASATVDASTQATSDSFIMGFSKNTSGADINIQLKTDSSNPPTTIRSEIDTVDDFATNSVLPFSMTVKKDDYYFIDEISGTLTTTAFIIPLS